MNTWTRHHLAQMRAAGLTPRGPLAACYAFKGDSESSSGTYDNRIGVSDQGRVLQITGGVSIGGSSGGSATSGRTRWQSGHQQYQTADGGWSNTKPAATSAGGTSGLVYTEAGGTSIFGTGNTLNLTDGGLGQAALATVQEVTDKSLAQIKELVADKTPDASVQNKQLAYAAIIGLMAVGGLYMLNRKS